ncbi:SRPBCC family protein [Methylosoma difficile]
MLEILLVVAVLAVIAVLLISKQPAEFTITRSAIMAAPAEAIFPHVNNLQWWHAWSPWAKLDPHSKSTFEGPESGVGAVMRWVGNNQVGEGSMTITDSQTNQAITFKLEFLKPFVATNTAVFTFASDAGQTTVTWSMSGHNNFMAKAMNLVMNCDKMVGGQFEKGLASLQAVVEAEGQ